MEKISRFFYDKNINSFSPEGRLYQVEYAIKGSDVTGSTCIVTKGLNTVCLVEEKKEGLVNTTSQVDSISYKLSNYIGCVCSGVAGDLKNQVSEIVQEFCNHYEKNGFEISIEQLANSIAIKTQILTQQSFSRLPAIKTIFFGIDRETGPLIIKMDPTGYFSSHSFCAIGEKSYNFMLFTQKNRSLSEIKKYNYEKTVIITISFLQNVLKNDLKAIDLKITVISGKNGHQILSFNEIDNYLEKLKKINQIIHDQDFCNF
jgi:20S proteasome subunit alpha 1